MNKVAYAQFTKWLGKKIENGFSPAGNWLGGTMLRFEEDMIRVSYEVRHEMCNPMKILHGGISSLMMDEVIGMANYLLEEEFLMSSVNLNVDFLSTAKMGEILEVEARLIRSGAKLNHWEAVIKKDNGKIVAKATSNMIKTHVKLSDLGI